MAVPVVKCQGYFQGSVSPGYSSTAWSDLTSRMRSWSIRRGRQRQLDRIESGTATIVFDNADRALDPEYTGSPYYPNVDTMVPIRLMAGYLAEVLLDAPTYWLRLNETGEPATTPDETNPGAVDAVMNGAVSLVDGIIPGNSAMDFDGTTGYLSQNYDSARVNLTTKWTIALWINPDTVAAAGLVVKLNAADADPGEYNLRLTAGGEIEFLSDTGSTVTTSGANITAGGGWYFVVCTFDSTLSPKCRIYVNAVERGSGSPDNPDTSATKGVLFGRKGTGGFFNGQMDEIKLYQNRWLSADRVSALYEEALKNLPDGFLYTGFADGFPQTYPANGFDNEVTVQCSDAFKILANIELKDSVWATWRTYFDTIFTDVKAWYRFADPNGTTEPRDSGPNNFTGAKTVGSVELTDASNGVLPYGTTGALKCAASGSRIDLPIASAIGTPSDSGGGNNYTIEFVLQKDGSPGGDQEVFEIIGGSSSQDQIRIAVQSDGDITFTVVLNTLLFTTATSAQQLGDGKPHHVACRRFYSGGGAGIDTIKIYIDGVQGATLNVLNSGTIASITKITVGDGLADWKIGELVLYQVAEATGDILSNAGYAITPFDGDTAGSRILTMLDWVSQTPGTVGQNDIEDGVSTLQATGFSGSVLEHILRVVDTEEGLFEITPAGNARFQGRDAFVNNAPVATFGDDQESGELPYLREEPIQFERDDEFVFNDVQIGREGGAVVAVEDGTSRDKYGRHTFQRTDLMHDNDLETEDHANWVLSRNKDAYTEVRQLSFNPYADDDLWREVFRNIGDLITVKRRPRGEDGAIVGDAISKDVRIQGITIDSPHISQWKVTWQLSGHDVFTYWILGDATYGVLGTTTRLGF